MIIGKHVSIAGGIDKAPARAKKINCNSLQIFSKNPRSWRGRKLKENEGVQVKAEMDKLSMITMVVHAIYLINLATPKDELWDKSIQAFQDDYNRSGGIAADYLVVHPGSHTGSGLEKGTNRISQALNRVLENCRNNTMILLENVAGAGSSIGSKFHQLHDIINGVEEKNRIGICVDTCHAFSAGYDLRSKDGLNCMLNELDSELGLDYLKVIHINDSKYKLGTNKDEHAHIGKGEIGEDGFARIINHPELRDLPFILETPEFSGQDEDVELLLSLRNT